jgi:DNA-binding phage protein
MIDMGVLGESQTRRDLAHLLHTAVERSGRNRCEIAREADLHKDALRRTLAGERSPSVGEALRILASSGMAPHAHLLLFLGAGGDLRQPAGFRPTSPTSSRNWSASFPVRARAGAWQPGA